MTTVHELIEELRKFPADARCYSCDGEQSGLVIMSSDDKQTIGHIATSDAGTNATQEIVY